MECPAQSPDLIPIELFWDELDRGVKAKQLKSVNIYGNFCSRYGKSFLKNILFLFSAVISAKGVC